MVANELFNEKAARRLHQYTDGGVQSAEYRHRRIDESASAGQIRQVDIICPTSALKHTLTGRDERTLMNTIRRPMRAGVHMVGPKPVRLSMYWHCAQSWGHESDFRCDHWHSPDIGGRVRHHARESADEDRRAAE